MRIESLTAGLTALRLLGIWSAGLCGLVLAQRVRDGHVDWDSVLGLAIGSLVGPGAIRAVALLCVR
jgi:hypothetical protein